MITFQGSPPRWIIQRGFGGAGLPVFIKQNSKSETHKMKNILTGNEAIEAYENILKSKSSDNVIKACGYFTSDDCEKTSKVYDKGTIVAFDSISETIAGDYYESEFATVNEAIDWINI